MAYKWKPSKSAKREFAEKMANDSEFRDSYYQRKEDKAIKRRAGSKFDYSSAGGNYIPTQFQYQQAVRFLEMEELSPEQKNACNQIIYGYTCQEKIHHDQIHIVNELTRSNHGTTNVTSVQ